LSTSQGTYTMEPSVSPEKRKKTMHYDKSVGLLSDPIFQSLDIQFQLCLTFFSQDLPFKSRIQSRWTLLLQRWILSFYSTCATHWLLSLLKGEGT
jgi:hypothetical protein